MTIRGKIALLITAAGFVSSLVFSSVILWEMMEQPFRIMDSDLETAARTALDMAVLRPGTGDTGSGRFSGGYTVDNHYWIKIYRQDTGMLVYQSQLAGKIHIKEPDAGPGLTMKISIPEDTTGQIRAGAGKVTFRVKKFFMDSGGKKFRICAGRPMEKLAEELWDVFVGLAAGLVFSVLVLMGLSYFVAGIILRPVKKMNDMARDITEKHLDRRIPVKGDGDEFNTLACSLNQVFERLEHAFMRQKQLLADASHELKTPLTMMRLALEDIGRPDAPMISMHDTRNISWLTDQVLRMERLVKNLLDLSSLEMEQTLEVEKVDLSLVLGSLVNDYAIFADSWEISMEAGIEKGLIVCGEYEKLTRAFSNLLDNALKYHIKGGKVRISAQVSGSMVDIKIANQGEGVPAKYIDRVFHQFFRVEQSRSLHHGGTGLGLAIAKEIIELHNGRIMFESVQNAWTRVKVEIPFYSDDRSSRTCFSAESAVLEAGTPP
jgi:signal transduction histidine kinase